MTAWFNSGLSEFRLTPTQFIAELSEVTSTRAQSTSAVNQFNPSTSRFNLELTGFTFQTTPFVHWTTAYRRKRKVKKRITNCIQETTHRINERSVQWICARGHLRPIFTHKKDLNSIAIQVKIFASNNRLAFSVWCYIIIHVVGFLFPLALSFKS
jgi:hypothetical protein